ncbi:hypothetical protein QN355_17820 [Cryobacterium sp. 10S3]|nr:MULTISPECIES: hypothetical protein [unclassified Cryobacterium]MEB0202162.1 hypothetical protein [Cryobacterium sp. 5I3]MDY7544393.1 hypothetical protein [Cryobacterium sp. 5B3]MEA9998794.1 hypothetical protein [Cryobacterium sp. RTS3]MEB0004435.1 hypothetical protein [Cryobacterium sp. RTC2.1]MEB0268013.1 hypothetical protein [Cryobacterium sp. 10I5]
MSERVSFQFFFGNVDEFAESVRLFLFRKVHEDLDDHRPLAAQMRLEVRNRAMPFSPDGRLVDEFGRDTLAVHNLRVRPRDENFFVV